jgi:hypothetical protein
LVGCLAHARRGFHEALGEGRAAAWLVGQIGQLYAVEKHLREQKAGPQLRAAVRAWQSRPVLVRLRRALEIIRRRVLPKSLLGQAIDYTLSRWEALTRYLDEGRLEIDNNLCENITQSFGLHSLCRDANNAEFTQGRMVTLKQGIENQTSVLGIIKSPQERPRGAKTLARLGVEAALVLGDA